VRRALTPPTYFCEAQGQAVVLFGDRRRLAGGATGGALYRKDPTRCNRFVWTLIDDSDRFPPPAFFSNLLVGGNIAVSNPNSPHQLLTRFNSRGGGGPYGITKLDGSRPVARSDPAMQEWCKMMARWFPFHSPMTGLVVWRGQ